MSWIRIALKIYKKIRKILIPNTPVTFTVNIIAHLFSMCVPSVIKNPSYKPEDAIVRFIIQRIAFTHDTVWDNGVNISWMSNNK